MTSPDETEYQLARDGRTFGPYTEAEIRERLANGHVFATDIGRSAAMDEWLPVAVLFPAPSGPVPGVRAGGLPRTFQDPPDLHWSIVLLLAIVTATGFSIVWSLWQAVWLKRVQPRSSALLYYAAFSVLWLLKAPNTWRTVLFNLGIGLPPVESHGLLLGILSAVFFCVSHLVMRRELLEHFNRDEPVGLDLSWLLSLVCGDIYFQYAFNRINAVKRTLRSF